MKAALPYLIRSVAWSPVAAVAALVTFLALVDTALAPPPHGALIVVSTAAMLSSACVVGWDPAGELLRALPTSTLLLHLGRVVGPCVLTGGLSWVVLRRAGEPTQVIVGLLALTLVGVALTSHLGWHNGLFHAASVLPFLWTATATLSAATGTTPTVTDIWREQPMLLALAAIALLLLPWRVR